MNCTYRSIWNDTTGTFVAVPENAKSAGKKTFSGTRVTGHGAGFALQALAISVALSFGATAYALPTGGVVAAGSASISANTLGTTINQSTQNAAINWQSFNIAAGESVRFNQPSSSSVTLNRVLGADPSGIFGSLTASGKVFLVNPNGILFGRGASVNVGGLVASTLNIADSDFMAGNYKFTGAGNGTVLNQGSINADGGYVALLGANVSNDGVISAKLGTVALAAGNAITLDLVGDGLLNVTVNQGVANALVQNGGLIQADGGQVLLTAQAAGSLLQSAVNNTGVIQAQTIQNHNGSIKLLGDMQNGRLNVGGTLDASAPNGGDGGFIETSAAHVKVTDNAIVSTQSAQGKVGTWLIDPADFTIAATGDIAGTTLAQMLVSNNITISTVVTGVNTATALYGATSGQGDINVNEAIGGGAPLWTATPNTTTLTLNAYRDVNVNAAITATNGNLVACCGRDVNVRAAITTTNGSVLLSAGRDVNILRTAGNNATAITTTDGNIEICAGNNINLSNTFNPGTTLMTLTRGSVTAGQSLSNLGVPRGLTLIAGNNGTGPGTAGGTVVFTNGGLAGTFITTTGPAPVTPTNIYYNPSSYTTPTNYSTFFTGDGSPLTQYMLVFPGGADKTYDGTTTATFTGLKGSPAGVTLAGAGTATFDTADAGTDKTITFSGFTLAQGATQTGGTGINFALPVTCCAPIVSRTSATITAAPLFLTVTASDVTKTYGQTAVLSEFTSVGLQGGETIGLVTLTSPGTPASANVATYAITASDARGGTFIPGNYTISYVNGVLSVVPVTLTITASNVAKSYGQTPALTAFTTAGLINGDTVGSVTETSPGQVATASVVGSPYAIIPSAATGGTFVPANYTIGYVNGVLTVAPVPLTVTANDASKAYGTTVTLPLNAFTTVGLINGDTVTSVIEVSPGAVASAPVAGSPYAITPSSAAGSTFTPSNYTINYVNGKLTVTAVPLSVTANDAAKIYGDTVTLPLTAFTTVGLVNGDTVSSVTETSPGTVVNASVAGSPYVITPSGAAGSSFAPSNYIISYVNGKLTVSPKALTGTITAADKIYDTTTAATITGRDLIGEVGADVVSYTGGTANFDTPNVGVGKTVTGTGLGLTGTGAANYTVNSTATTTASILPIVPSVTPSDVAPRVTPVTWIPVIAPVTTPPQLLALMSPVPPVVAVTQAPVVVEEQAPVVVPVETPPTIYLAPQRPRKQDRN